MPPPDPQGDRTGSMSVDEARVSSIEDRVRSSYRQVEFAIREATMLLGHDGRISSQIRLDELLGVEAADLLDTGPVPPGWSITTEDGQPMLLDDHPAMRALHSGETVEQVVAYVSDAGARRLLRFIAYPVRDDDRVAVDAVVNDHDRRQRQRETVQRQDRRFRTMADLLPVAVWEAAVTGEITYVNPKFTGLTGLEMGDVPDLPMLELVHPDDVLTVMQDATDATSEGRYLSHFRLRHRNGTARWVASRMSLLVDDDGNVCGFAGSMEDIDDLRRSEQRSARLAEIVEVAGDAIVVVEDGAVTYLNRSATALLERADPAFATDRRHHTFLAQFLERYHDAVDAALRATGEWSSDVRLLDVGGDPVDLSISVRAEVSDGVIGRSVVMARDIGARKRREDRLAHEAVHDPLTGLANRQGLERAVGALDPDDAVQVCFVDVDHFKEINDTLGHAAGDAVLIDVASRIRAAAGEVVVVARVGGDEIVVVRRPGGLSDTELGVVVTESISHSSVTCDERSWPVTVSAGIASGPASDIDRLRSVADAQLYAAKRAGRNTFRVAVL